MKEMTDKEFSKFLGDAIDNSEKFSMAVKDLREEFNLTPVEFCISIYTMWTSAESAMPQESKAAKQLIEKAWSKYGNKK